MNRSRSLFRSSVGTLLAGIAITFAPPTFAGVDLQGVVNGLQIGQDGAIWFSITPTAGTPSPATYCRPGWAGLNMVIPASNPQYAYYYGLLMTSFTKNASIYIANISVFNGSTACDITQTGYGLLLVK